MNKEKILLVEDCPITQKSVQALIEDFCSLSVVPSIQDAKTVLNSESFDLAVLDVKLSDGDGFELCKYIREHEKSKNLPVIFLTGRSEVDDRVRGFDLGADDYIVKPLEPREFVARVKSKISRKAKAEAVFESGPFRADVTAQRVSVQTAEGIKNLDLTPIEFRLFAYLMRNEGVIYSRSELLKAVWGETHVSEHTVDTHISSLRKKLGDWGRCIKVKVKQGYCFIRSF